MSDLDFSFDPEPEFDPDDSVEGLVINWVSALAWWAGKRVFRYGKHHYPKVRSVADSRWAVASEWKPVSIPFRIGRWAFRTTRNEVRAFMGVREPVRSIVAGFIAFHGAVIVWDHFVYPAEIPEAVMMAFGAYFMVVLGIIGFGMSKALVQRLRPRQ